MLTDRVVVITGGARGIGRAYTDAFLEAGAKVVSTDRSWEDTEPSFGDQTRDGANLLRLVMDVANDDDVDAAYDRTLAQFGTVDVLINNAALRQNVLFPPTGRTTTLATTSSDWQRSFAVNTFGALNVTRRFIRPMLEKQRGSIINTVSSGVLNASRGGAYTASRPNSREMPYQASKAALATMSLYLADEVRDDNVAVNVLVPGHTRTTGFDAQNLARMQAGMTNQVGPAPVVPEHMVPITLFLAAQDAAGGNTGKIFDVMRWNAEHGFGGHERWQDASFSYASLQTR